MADPKSISRLLKFITEKLRNPASTRAVHFLKIVEGLLLYQLEELEKKENNFYLREILFLLEQKLGGVFKTAGQSIALLDFIIGQKGIKQRRTRINSE